MFTEPVLTRADLESIGLYYDQPAADSGIMRFVCQEGGARVTDCDFRLVFDHGKLAGLVFPGALLAGLGRENIEGLLRMAGGDDSVGSGMRRIRKDQLAGSNLLGLGREAMGPTLIIKLTPKDPRNRSIKLTMRQGDDADSYSRFLLQLGVER